MFSALTIKLFRDLWRYRAANVAIALIVACGVASQVTAFSLIHSIESALANFYQKNRFADLFVHTDSVALSKITRLRAINGITAVQPRIVTEGALCEPNTEEARVIANMIAVPDDCIENANVLEVRSGVGLDSLAKNQIIISEVFAEARNISIGTHLELTVDDRTESYHVAGIAISPEFAFQIREGDGIPDNARYAIVWMRFDDLSRLSRRANSANSLCIRTADRIPSWSIQDCIHTELARNELVRIVERKDHLSHRYTTNGIAQLYSVAIVPPAIFFAVAAFQVYIALARLMKAEREDIAMQRAFGYSRFAIATHYLKYVLIVVLVGATIGICVGNLFTQHATSMYRQIYRFPELPVQISLFAVLLSTSIASSIALAGGGFSILKIASQSPALCLRPEAPPSHRLSWLDRITIRLSAQPIVQMAIRSLLRWKLRTALGIAGLSLGVAVLILGSYTQACIAYVIDYEFFFTRRYDLALQFAPGTTNEAVDEIRRFDGVLRCEPVEMLSAKIVFGNDRRTITLTALPHDGELISPLTGDLQTVPMFRRGIAVSEEVATVLGASVGDPVDLELFSGANKSVSVRITSIFRDYSGLNAYASIDDVKAWLDRPNLCSAAIVRVNADKVEQLAQRLDDLPRVRSVHRKSSMIQNFRENDEKNLLVFRIFNIIFSGVIGVGAVYSVASISAIERRKDLALMRVLGHTPLETGVSLIGEMLIMVVIAMPLGCVAGYWFASIATDLLNSETQRIPLLVNPATYASGVSVSFGSFAIAALFIQRLIYRLDCVSILKSSD